MPVIIQLRVEPGTPILRGNERMWAVMMELSRAGAGFTVTQIWEETNITRRCQVEEYVTALSAAGILERVGSVPHGARVRQTALYRVVRPAGKAPKVRPNGEKGEQGQRNQHMWNILRRARDGVDAPTLAMLASTASLPVAKVTAQHFLAALDAAGYLHRVLEGRRGRGGRHTVYRLWPGANSGPLAPLLLKSSFVFDANLNAIRTGRIVAQAVTP